MAKGSSLHQQAKQQLHEHIRTYIQPLMRAGKQLNLKDMQHHVTIRKPTKLGTQQFQHIVRLVL